VSTFFEETHIQSILQSVNIIDLISNYVSLKPRGKEMVGLCPFHDDKKPSLYVNESKQIFKCFACGVGGDAFKFIMLRERMTFPEAVQILADRAGVELPKRRTRGQSTETHSNRNELEALNRWVAGFFRRQYKDEIIGERPRTYVRDRGIREDIARQFGIGWSPQGWDHLVQAAQAADVPLGQLRELGLLVEKEKGGYYDRFRERLIFPIVDPLKRVIGFGGRTLGDDPAKYLNSPENVLFNKSRSLYGLHAAKDSIVKQRTVVVVEGYTDCIMAHQCQVTNVVATLGTALTAEHARMLSRYADQVVMVFDSDQAGQKAADRAIEVFLGQKIDVRLVTLPQAQDPCEFLLEHGDQAKKVFEALITQATEALEYKWQVLSERLMREDTTHGRRRAVEEFLSLIAQAVGRGEMDEIGRGFLINRVAKLVQVSSADVHQRVNRMARRFRDRKQMVKDKVGSIKNQIFDEGRTHSQIQVLEVLLNRPDLFPQVREVIKDVKEFNDPVLQQIAQRLWDYLEQGGRGSLGEMMAGCSSTEICAKMADLAERGADRGNDERTLQDALENIKKLEKQQSWRELRDLAPQAGEKFGPEASDAMLLDYQAQYKTDMRRAGTR